jgi:hypothetical protein
MMQEEEEHLKRGGKYQSRAHTKREKREQRKKWLKRKKEKLKEDAHLNSGNVDLQQEASGVQGSKKIIPSRGRKIVELALATSNKRKANHPRGTVNVHENTVSKKFHPQQKTDDAVLKTTSRPFKEINRRLIVQHAVGKIGSAGTFGNCYLGVYRGEFKVVVKEIKQVSNSVRENEKAKQEVIHEASALSLLGDHVGLPHLFGVCTDESPYCLILQFHCVDSKSLTLYEAASSCLHEDLSASIAILKDVCETLGYIHTQGFLHNDLKGNNIVLEKTVKGFHPVIIDFGKSIKIKKAKLKKPKLDMNSALKRYPHIAPEIHRGERQTTSSDIFSFGYLVSFIKNKAKLNAFCIIVKKCTSSVPSKRPSLREISEMLSDSLVVNN